MIFHIIPNDKDFTERGTISKYVQVIKEGAKRMMSNDISLKLHHK